MSNIYVQEPPTNGKVLLVTSVGDIDVELWSKEAPKACRNFVQLCMEGYYNGTTFFRVVRNFIVQGGDPTNTGTGGKSIYGKPFQDEIHSRLRFVRRGLVAMANAGPNDNESQFFFTLAATPDLANKHTIFGRVAGDTIFNMIKLGEVPTDKDERPLNPLKIIRTEILNNPFDDIVPRLPTKKTSKDKASSSEESSKATKNFSLLSFGEEAEEDEGEVTKAAATVRHKGKSSHDLLNDAKLSSVPAVDDSDNGKRKTETASDDEDVVPSASPEKKPSDHDANTDNKPSGEGKKKLWNRPGVTSEKIKDVANMAENSATSKATAGKMEKLPPQLKGKDRENATLKMLEKFKSKLEDVKKLPQHEDDYDNESKEKLKDVEEVGCDLGWTNHKLQFEEKEQKVIDANVQDSERYQISDPRNPMVIRRRHEDKSESSHKKQKTEFT